eukprot:4533670-Pyramimonas_sp.AAC.1
MPYTCLRCRVLGLALALAAPTPPPSSPVSGPPRERNQPARCSHFAHRECEIDAPPLPTLAQVLLCLPCTGLPSVSGQWYPFEGGVVFLSPHMAPLVLHFASHITGGRLHPATDDAPAKIAFQCNTRPVRRPR